MGDARLALTYNTARLRGCKAVADAIKREMNRRGWHDSDVGIAAA
jgi:hypothetical protein